MKAQHTLHAKYVQFGVDSTKLSAYNVTSINVTLKAKRQD